MNDNYKKPTINQSFKENLDRALFVTENRLIDGRTTFVEKGPLETPEKVYRNSPLKLFFPGISDLDKNFKTSINAGMSKSSMAYLPSIIHLNDFAKDEIRVTENIPRGEFVFSQFSQEIPSLPEIRDIFLMNSPHKKEVLPNKEVETEKSSFKWSEEERNILRELVTKFDGKNWKYIANELGTGRSASQCRDQWKRVCYPWTTGEWNDEELENLKALVAFHGKRWSIIGKKLGRLPSRCQRKWKAVCQEHKKGMWQEEEIKDLQNLMKVFGNKWSEISSKLKVRRTAKQCQRKAETLK